MILCMHKRQMLVIIDAPPCSLSPVLLGLNANLAQPSRFNRYPMRLQMPDRISSQRKFKNYKLLCHHEMARRVTETPHMNIVMNENG